jgi:hypothetical protein
LFQIKFLVNSFKNAWLQRPDEWLPQEDPGAENPVH